MAFLVKGCLAWSTHKPARKNPRLTCRRGYQFRRCIWEDEINAAEDLFSDFMLRRNINRAALQEKLI